MRTHALDNEKDMLPDTITKIHLSLSFSRMFVGLLIIMHLITFEKAPIIRNFSSSVFFSIYCFLVIRFHTYAMLLLCSYNTNCIVRMNGIVLNSILEQPVK